MSNMIYIDDSEPEEVLEPSFPYRDVTISRGVNAKEMYEILSEVGRGKFGTVYKCQEKHTGLKLAAKFVPIPKREDRRNVEREVEIMNSLQHHLIIQLYAAYEYQKMMCVVLELVEGGELFDRVVEDEFVLTERVCVVIIRQVCEAMEFIHRNNILHLDLKPENILCLTQEGNRIKIIDFGLARKYDPDKKLQVLFGTPEFVAPEVVNFDCISYATDMWSVGVICYVLISGLSPFMGETDIETMANVTIAKYDFDDESFSNISQDCIDFISKLLVKDLDVRMTAAQCLEHKWLKCRPKPATTISKKSTKLPMNDSRAAKPTPSPVAVPQVDENKDGTVTGESKELESTKDNLKHFIERWEEHPNSPYVFDVESNVIAPLTECPSYEKIRNTDSISSSRVCSPSPCESISTLTDDEHFLEEYPNDSPNAALATPINESVEKIYPFTMPNVPNSSPSGVSTPTPQHAIQYAPQHLFDRHKWDQLTGSTSNLFQQRTMKSYLHTFDRRNSDTNYVLGRRPSGERVNLAEEIRKLSDHLLMLAEINKKLGTDRSKDVSEMSANLNEKSSLEAIADSESAVRTAVGDQKDQKVSANTTRSSSSSSHDKAKFSSVALRLQKSIEEMPTLTNGGNVPWKSTKPTTSTLSSSKKTTSISTVTTTTATAANVAGTHVIKETASTRRSKFRVSQMSRDVPIGLPDTHQTVNLEEAANTTKDCLLHLLEKYNETKCRNPLTRHQSISVDWHMSDNLEYRSMSSINAFFRRHNNSRNNVRQLQAQLEGKANRNSTGTGS